MGTLGKVFQPRVLALKAPSTSNGWAAHGWTHEVPLPTTEVARTRNEDDPLIEAAKLNPKPAFILATHVGANHAVGNVAPIRVRPSYSAKADVCPGFDETVSSEPVQIQLQSILAALQINFSKVRTISHSTRDCSAMLPSVGGSAVHVGKSH
jgi:hypothetical protein